MNCIFKGRNIFIRIEWIMSSSIIVPLRIALRLNLAEQFLGIQCAEHLRVGRADHIPIDNRLDDDRLFINWLQG